MSINSLAELECLLKALLPKDATLCATITIPVNPRDPSPAVDLIRFDSFLADRSIAGRSPERNRFRGFVLSRPRSRSDAILLGRTYWDAKDSRDNEDIFEVLEDGVSYLKPRLLESKYPEYADTHWGDKSYLQR